MSKLPSPNPSTLVENQTFAREAAAQYGRRPAQGPYTVGLGNNAVYLALADVAALAGNTAGSSALAAVDSIRRQLASGEWAAFLPATADASVRAGYEAQLRVLAAKLAATHGGHARLRVLLGRHTLQHRLALDAAEPRQPCSSTPTAERSADGAADPVLDYRTASNPVDLALLAAFVPVLQRYLRTPAMVALGVKETAPGPSALPADDSIVAYVRDTANPTGFHPCCTAAMLPRNKGGVVDTQLQVYGAPGLRVVDASVFPTIPATHTSATVYAVAEKAADIIIRAWTSQ